MDPKYEKHGLYLYECLSYDHLGMEATSRGGKDGRIKLLETDQAHTLYEELTAVRQLAPLCRSLVLCSLNTS